jgi:quinol monooxygenase YgiN
VVRSLLYLRPKRGERDAVVAFYRRHRVLERALEQDGCLAAELAVPAEGDGDIVVTALWADAAAYEGWVSNPARAANAEELAALVDGEFDAAVRGELYEVLLSAPPRWEGP